MCHLGTNLLGTTDGHARTHAHTLSHVILLHAYVFFLRIFPAHSHVFYFPALSFKGSSCKRTFYRMVPLGNNCKNTGYVVHNGPLSDTWQILLWTQHCVAHRLEVVRLHATVRDKENPTLTPAEVWYRLFQCNVGCR
jgi:hypothetical protein